MIINKILDIKLDDYTVHVEYEATANAHDDIDIEYNILGGINEIEIIKRIYGSNLGYDDFQEKVVELIDKIKLQCSLDAEAEYINKTVDMLEYSEER